MRTKQAVLKLSNEADLLAFKQFKETYCVGKSNSEVLSELLTLGTQFYQTKNVGTHLGTHLENVGTQQQDVGTQVVPHLGTQVELTDLQNKINSLEITYDNNFIELAEFKIKAFEQILKLSKRVSKLEPVEPDYYPDLEASVFQNVPEI